MGEIVPPRRIYMRPHVWDGAMFGTTRERGCVSV